MIIRPNSRLFVDTSGWAEPLLQNTPYFAVMDAFAKQIIARKRSLITTNYVISELIALVTARRGVSRTNLIQFVNQIKQMSQVQIIHIDEATDDEAWAMLEKYADKQWSLVDAASFVVMRRLGIVEAFTSDEHFVQAGFTRVPHQ